MPIKNPPMCAHHATPPEATAPNAPIPSRHCSTNQYPKTKKAGTGTKNTKNSIKTRARGNNTAYAPITPLIAPLAPRAGREECRLNNEWISPDPIPHAA